MAFPSLIVCKARLDGAATDQGAVYVVEGGTSVRQIGASFGASTVETGAGHNPACRAIKFNGKLYAWNRNVIREYNPDTNLWTTALTIGDHSTVEQHAAHTGLYYGIVNDKPSIFGIYQANTLNSIRIVLYDGTTWTTTTTGPNAGGAVRMGPGFLFRGKLWVPTNSGANEVIAADPATGSVSLFDSNSANDASRMGGCFVSFRGRLLAIGPASTANRTQVLFEISAGGQFNVVQTLLTGSTQGTEANHGSFAWATTNEVYAILNFTPVTNQPSFRLLKLTPTSTGGPGDTFVNTDISTTVLPPAVRGNIGLNQYIAGFSDNTIPGSPKVYLRFLTDPANWDTSGQGSSIWQFIDDSTEIVPLGPGPSTAIVWPHDSLGGGEYIWSDVSDLTKLDLVIERVRGISGGTRVFFRCKNGGGTDFVPRTVKLYFTPHDIAQMDLCTLFPSTVSGGASNTSSQITNVDDDGSILYQVDWDSVTDGVADVAKINMVGTIE